MVKYSDLDRDKTYYVCTESTGGGYQFVIGQCPGGGIHKPDEIGYCEIYFSFKILEDYQDTLTACRPCSVRDSDEMWGANIKDVKDVEYPEREAIIDIFTRYRGKK